MTQMSTPSTVSLQPPLRGLASLRTRLIVAMTAIVAIAVIVLGVYVYVRLQQSNAYLANQLDANVMQQAQDTMTSAGTAQAASFNEFFGSMRRDLSILSTTTTGLLTHQATSTSGTLLPFTLNHLPNGSWDNPNGDPAAVFIPAKITSTDALVPELNTLRQLDTVVPEVKQADTDAVAIYFGGLSGETVYYPNIDLANIVPPDFDVTQRPWYIEASPAKNPSLRPVWTVPYLDAARHGLVVTVSSPVFDATGKFRGVIAMDVQLNRIADLVTGVKVGQTGFAMLVDKQMRVIAMPPAAYSALGVTEQQLPLGNTIDPQALGSGVPADFLPMLKRLAAGHTAMETIQIDGTDRFVSGYEVPEVGYSLVLVVPSQELLGGAMAARQQAVNAAANTLRISLILAFLILLLALAATFLLANSMTSPLVSLTRTAEEIIDGNLNARSTVESRDEIGILARTLNSMTSALRGSIQTLEQRVRDRTSALEAATRQANRRASQFEAITQVTRAISAVRNLRDLMPLVTSVISQQFNYYHVGIFLSDENHEYTYLIAANSEGGQHMLDRHHRLKIGEQGIVGRVAQTGETRVARSVGKDSVYFDNPDLPGTKSEVALPLRSGDRIVGVLDVQSTEEDAFSAEDLDVLAVLADQVSLAIDNTRLFETTRRSLAESETLYRQYVRGAWDRMTHEEELAGYRYTSLGAVPLHRLPSGRIEDEPVDTPATSHGNRLSVPIRLRDEIIGELQVQGPEGSAWDEEQQALMQAVADRVALSMENARLFDETARRAERERLVTEISSRIRSTNDPQQMIRTALDELRNALGAAQIQVIPQKLPGNGRNAANTPPSPDGSRQRRSTRDGAPT